MKNEEIIGVLFINVIPTCIILYGLYLSFKTPILKDESTAHDKPFSFARTQLMWWSLIIISSFSAAYGFKKGLPEIDSSLLVLLGISAGTTVLSRIIDNTDIISGKIRHQDDNNYICSFFRDMLTDENGISVHRFQALIFNILFGIIFIIEFLGDKEHNFIPFTALQLSLMGISSAAYVGIKLNENNTKNVK